MEPLDVVGTHIMEPLDMVGGGVGIHFTLEVHVVPLVQAAAGDVQAEPDLHRWAVCAKIINSVFLLISLRFFGWFGTKWYYNMEELGMRIRKMRTVCTQVIGRFFYFIGLNQKFGLWITLFRFIRYQMELQYGRIDIKSTLYIYIYIHIIQSYNIWHIHRVPARLWRSEIRTFQAAIIGLQWYMSSMSVFTVALFEEGDYPLRRILPPRILFFNR